MKANNLAQLPTFDGMESENLYSHVHDFKALCQPLSEPNTSSDTMRLTFFPFTFFPFTLSEAMAYLNKVAEMSKGWKVSQLKEMDLARP